MALIPITANASQGISTPPNGSHTWARCFTPLGDLCSLGFSDGTMPPGEHVISRKHSHDHQSPDLQSTTRRQLRLPSRFERTLLHDGIMAPVAEPLKVRQHGEQNPRRKDRNAIVARACLGCSLKCKLVELPTRRWTSSIAKSKPCSFPQCNRIPGTYSPFVLQKESPEWHQPHPASPKVLKEPNNQLQSNWIGISKGPGS